MRRRASGFTLIEVLFSIAILATVTAIVSTVFFTGVNSWRTGTAAADAMHHIDAVMEQITAGLRSAYYPESKEPLDKYGFVQESDGDDMPDCADKISWVKLGASLVGEDASYAAVPHRTELFLMDDSDGPQGAGLYVRAWRLDGQEEDFDPEEDVDPVLLSSAVSGFDCKMLDPEKEIDNTEEDPYEDAWLDEWEPTNRVPTKVLLSISVAPAPESKLEPLILTRLVEIPLADLSWNPVDTTSESSSDNRNGIRRSNGSSNRSTAPSAPSRNSPSGTNPPRMGPTRAGPSRSAPTTAP